MNIEVKSGNSSKIFHLNNKLRLKFNYDDTSSLKFHNCCSSLAFYYNITCFENLISFCASDVCFIIKIAKQEQHENILDGESGRNGLWKVTNYKHGQHQVNKQNGKLNHLQFSYVSFEPQRVLKHGFIGR